MGSGLAIIYLICCNVFNSTVRGEMSDQIHGERVFEKNDDMGHKELRRFDCLNPFLHFKVWVRGARKEEDENGNEDS